MSDPLHAAPAGRGHPWLRPALVVGPIVLIAVILVALSLTRAPADVFVATPDGRASAADSSGFRILTVDGTDPVRWRFLSLEQGRAIETPGAGNWDMAVRRFHIIANGGVTFAGRGGLVDLGEVPLDSASAPAGGYLPTTADSVNPAIERWYRYGFTSHLLTPLPKSYAFRTATGRTGVLAIVGYYCPGPTPGCVTIRYRLD